MRVQVCILARAVKLLVSGTVFQSPHPAFSHVLNAREKSWEWRLEQDSDVHTHHIINVPLQRTWHLYSVTSKSVLETTCLSRPKCLMNTHANKWPETGQP